MPHAPAFKPQKQRKFLHQLFVCKNLWALAVQVNWALINCIAEDFSVAPLIWMLFLFQNFVGLSVHDGYIATGSETNEVFNLYFVSYFHSLCNLCREHQYSMQTRQNILFWQLQVSYPCKVFLLASPSLLEQVCLCFIYHIMFCKMN